MINPDDFGVDAKTGIAGLCGGFLALLVMRELSVKQAFISITGGGFAAMYSTNLVMHLLSIPTEFAGGMGFAIGIFGLALIGKVLMVINSLTIEDMKEMTVSWMKALVTPVVEALSKSNKGKGGDK